VGLIDLLSTFSDAECGPDTDFDDDLFGVRFAVIEHTGMTVHWEWCAVRTLRLEPPMSNYRRCYVPGGSYFFTVVTERRAEIAA
jgi:hypothetical protein